jgi:hypothetical protein
MHHREALLEVYYPLGPLRVGPSQRLRRCLMGHGHVMRVTVY